MDIDQMLKDVLNLKRFIPMLEELYEYWQNRGTPDAKPDVSVSPAVDADLKALVDRGNDLLQKIEAAISGAQQAKADYDTLAASAGDLVKQLSTPQVTITGDGGSDEIKLDETIKAASTGEQQQVSADTPAAAVEQQPTIPPDRSKPAPAV